MLDIRGWSHAGLRGKMIWAKEDPFAVQKEFSIDKLIALANAGHHAKLGIGETPLRRLHKPMIPLMARQGWAR